jgi:UrcA family protein
MKNAELTRKLAGRSAAALLALTACVGMLSTASAATSDTDTPQVTVRYGDLDLSTQAGAKALYSRISMGARQVCPSDDSRDLSRFTNARACQRAAIERAVRAVNSPHLAAAYAAATHRG